MVLGKYEEGNLMVPGSIAKGIMLTEKLPDLWIELDEFWGLLCKLDAKEKGRRLVWSRLRQKVGALK